VLSEAGCPGIADPGAVAAKIAHTLGFRIIPLVGPNSIILALMASGFNGQSFAFLGYLPIDKALKIKEIHKIEQEAKRRNQTQIFMETPFRNNQLFEDIVANCQPETRLCVAANITAEDEFIKTDSIKNWKKNKPELHKKPCIFLLL
jgi:16S rRNA (cytidine1402-2'-O)-methyltransferase